MSIAINIIDINAKRYSSLTMDLAAPSAFLGIRGFIQFDLSPLTGLVTSSPATTEPCNSRPAQLAPFSLRSCDAAKGLEEEGGEGPADSHDEHEEVAHLEVGQHSNRPNTLFLNLFDSRTT